LWTGSPASRSIRELLAATARDAMLRDYKVVFLSDATETFDYPDVGQGGMSPTRCTGQH
jgi:nicotinamidase-related amidase